MYLKRLELQGFKSFPEKIKLEFNKGITAVVGPNGSGKSNIGDAVRWVLGEKSAKSLRGAKMEDVIFNGTANRKPMGFAEVSMVMDNTDRQLNLDFSEVTVTRRVYRSGESDYLINGTSCRLKDILELFMDTGVGKEGYSIIGQGRIDEILSTKSEDRRMLFEEAAGIVKYKTRRMEANHKLEKERANLVRVNDIISELEVQVGPLEKQAEKTKKYLVLADRLKLVQINLFVSEADRYEQELKSLNENIQIIRSDVSEQEQRETELENNKNSLKAQLNNIEIQMQQNTDLLAEKRSQREQKENDIKLLNQKNEHIKENIERLNQQLEQSHELCRQKDNEINIITANIQAKNLELKLKADEYNDKQYEFNKLNERVSESEELVNRYNADILSKMNVTNDLKSDIGKEAILIEQYNQSMEGLRLDNQALEGQLNHKHTELQVIELEGSRIDKEGALISQHIESFTSVIKEFGVKINNATNENQELTKSITAKNSRLKLLSELEKDYEGYYGGVKSILKQRDNKNPEFKGICGAVGEVITLEEQYETAIEIALGGALQNIITRNDEDVKKAINFLKNTKGGRATFLPMTAIKGKSLGEQRQSILKEKGVKGIAKELISYAPEYENIMSSLLDRVIVVDNIDSGTALAKKTRYAYKIVTLDGELFNAGGSVTGGSINKKSTGIFSRGREISTLKEELKELLERQLQLSQEINKNNEMLENTDYKLQEAKEDFQQLAIRRTEFTANQTACKNIISDIEEKIRLNTEKTEELAGKLLDADKKIAECNESLSIFNKEIDDLYAKLEEHQIMIKSDRDIREAQNQEILNLRLLINQLQNDVSTSNSEIERLKNEINSIYQQNSQEEDEIKQCNRDIENNRIKLDEIQNEKEALIKEYEEIQNSAEEFYSTKNKINEALEKIDLDVKELLETVSGLNNELTKLELKAEQSEQKSRQLYDSMWETYEITYVAAKEYEKLDVSTAELQKEERGLKSDIKALGSVNVNAVEEYQSVKERYDFLIKQQNDIISSEEKLNKLIKQLEMLMEDQFRSQFAIISENFSRVFKEMFGGGKAELKLADNEDILNCGIDIIAQPPGKALQNMNLLSGGEKAMTAISLLFAILEMKPSPFCILDEIEAALDDANVIRYAEYLKNFTDTTQFIVITHRKGTMEAADILYGVTMQEQGISKLVSVNFEEGQEVI